VENPVTVNPTTATATESPDFLLNTPPPPPPRELLQTPPSDIFEDTYIQLQDTENIERKASVDAIVQSLDQINITIRNASYDKMNKNCYVTKWFAGILFFGGILVLNDYILLKHFVQ
jgi:hypothetical protein